MKRAALTLAVVSIAAGARAQNPPVTIAVDADLDRHAIDPRIYGVNNGTGPDLADLNCPLTRLGGTFASRYNWTNNAYNRGNDYFFESIVEDGGDTTAGRHADDFVASASANGSAAYMTIPMVGYVAAVGAGGENQCSFPDPDPTFGFQVSAADGCGNGCARGGSGYPFCDTGTPITGNDPTLADVAADETFQANWVQHLIDTHGTAVNGGLRYYGYDNEPSIWYLSHRDVHPNGASMDEVRDKIVAYGHMIRSRDADAVLLGPEEFNWDGYFTSGADGKCYWDHQLDANAACTLDGDRNALGHDGADYIPWLLGALQQHQTDTGERVLDVLSVHFYPQGDGNGAHQEFSNDISSTTQLLRNRSTRSLWDPAYVDQSYMGAEPNGGDGGVLKVIPRLKGWVNTYYPGTLVGLSEYSWGPYCYFGQSESACQQIRNSMGGATVQADLLGIFGREGLDLAARWEIPDTGSAAYKAFKMYRNYDGTKATFGDTSVRATVPNADKVSAFAAQRAGVGADGALTIMVVSKALSGTTAATITVANFTSSMPAQVFRLAGNQITRQADLPMSGGALSLTLPPQSVTLLVLPQGTGPMVMAQDAAVSEPPAGQTTAVFNVTLSSASDQPVSVNYATADGTATAGLDYEATTGVVTFAPGETTATVGVAVFADALKEGNETFTLALSAPVNATIDRPVATGMIFDNSTAPRLQWSAAAYAVTEGNVKAIVTVKRTGFLGMTATVDYTTADGSATAGSDYSATSGTLTFASGVASRTLPVTIAADTLTEGDETVLLRLANPGGGALLGAQSTAVLTIRDNDPAGSFAFQPAAVRVTESMGEAVLSVRRTGGTVGTVTVDFATADGSADGSDYAGQTFTLTFAPGQTLQKVTIPIANDAISEGEEYFTATLANPTNGAKLGAASTATVTIASADQAVQFQQLAYAASEAATQALVAVKRTGSLAQPLTVDFATADGTAVAGTDYTATAGTVSFAKGVATRTFAVPLIRHDKIYAPPRTVALSIANPSAGVLGTSQATLTIKDDDVPGTVQFAVDSASVSEGAGTATIKVVRTGKLDALQSVLLTTTDGSAIAGTNYVDATQTLVFAAGETTKLVTVVVIDDGVVGPGALGVNLALGSPDGGAAVGPRAASTLWIVENR